MIRNLLFDLGGVITDIRRQDCERAFRALGFADIGDYLGDYGQKGPFMAVEDGSITPAQFRREIRALIPGGNATDSQIDQAFSAFITGIPRRRLEELEALRSRYRLYVVSNTNPIMWDGIIARLFAQRPGKRREDYFDGMVTSFEAGCAKPDPGIFRLVERKFGILPDETLFYDDSEANCRAAEALGFHSCHVAPGTEFYQHLPAMP